MMNIQDSRGERANYDDNHRHLADTYKLQAPNDK